MKLVTYTFRGVTRLGAMRSGDEIVDLARAGKLLGTSSIPPDMLQFLAGGSAAIDAARSALAAAENFCSSRRTDALETGLLFEVRDAGFRLEAPVMRPPKVLAIGLNYRDHAAEAGMEIPKRPVVFTKVASCITGPGLPIHRPRVSQALDWEGEFCIVIGKRARHVQAADALSCVAGYTIGNDVSVRDWQFHSGTWIMGKGFDTHGPIGPYLVTRDEAGDGPFDIRTWVNDELKQHSSTGQLIFGVSALIEYISTAFTLEPGDVIFTGTPSGVGFSRKPPQFLKAGDRVRVEISRLGTLENPVIDEPEVYE